LHFCFQDRTAVRGKGATGVVREDMAEKLQ